MVGGVRIPSIGEAITALLSDMGLLTKDSVNKDRMTSIHREKEKGINFGQIESDLLTLLVVHGELLRTGVHTSSASPTPSDTNTWKFQVPITIGFKPYNVGAGRAMESFDWTLSFSIWGL